MQEGTKEYERERVQEEWNGGERECRRERESMREKECRRKVMEEKESAGGNERA